MLVIAASPVIPKKKKKEHQQQEQRPGVNYRAAFAMRRHYKQNSIKHLYYR